MAIPYFIWNSTDSRNMHLRCNRMPIIRPEERVQHVTIPGRPGELTQVEGVDVYNSYIQTAHVTVVGADNIPAAEAWLKGDGYVTFHTQPTLEQKARIINAVTFEKHSRNVDTWHADVQFYCEPYKRLITEEDITVTESGTTITNGGALESYPRFVVNGSGAITITMGGHTIVLSNLVSGSVVDSDLGWVMQDGIPQPNAWTGEFPTLTAGDNSLLFTGSVTSIVVTPRARYI